MARRRVELQQEALRQGARLHVVLRLAVWRQEVLPQEARRGGAAVPKLIHPLAGCKGRGATKGMGYSHGSAVGRGGGHTGAPASALRTARVQSLAADGLHEANAVTEAAAAVTATAAAMAEKAAAAAAAAASAAEEAAEVTASHAISAPGFVGVVVDEVDGPSIEELFL